MKEITEERIHHLKSSILRLRQYLNFSNSLSQKPITYSSKKSIKDGDIILKKVERSENSNTKKKININKKKENTKSEDIIDGKITLLPGDCAVSQGDEGNTAYLIISGSFNVEIDKKVVCAMSPGEIFGELSLILGEKRKASIKAIVPTEIIEIKKNALEAILLSSNIELHKVIQQMSKELGKDSDHKLPITQKDLKELVKKSPDVIRALALQLHYRLSQRIFH